MSIPDPSGTATGLGGLRVAIFEARMAGPMADLIRKQGGEPVEAPALREVPIGDNPDAIAFADRLIAGEFDLVIFLTGVGTRYLAREIETKYPREEWVAALKRAKVAIRGPKPVAPLRELGARIDLQAPEPNTWRDLLGALDAQIPVDGLRVAVQEYGQPAPDLIQGLQARGATVTSVPVYGWALPEELGPLVRTIGEIAEGRIGAVVFTSAQQVVHLLQVAAKEGREAEVREALAKSVVVASVGPTTTEALKANNLPVDIEPEHPKMGHLAVALANGWRAVGKSSLGPNRNEQRPGN
jgi:uroporphyrinogen-III synthase